MVVATSVSSRWIDIGSSTMTSSGDRRRAAPGEKRWVRILEVRPRTASP
jgi:hypothetical protein